MPDILWGKGSYRRDNGNFTQMQLVNMLPEAAPTVEQGVALISRPGLELYNEVGDGPIEEIYRRPGLFNGDPFYLSGDDLYRGTDLLGTINGSGPARFANSSTELVVTRGATAYSYDGTDLDGITFPDSASVTAVAYLGGRFLFARAGSQRFYWSELSDGRTVGALSYTAADSAPDNLLDIIAVGDNVFAMGEESLEVHYLTTSITLPYARINQRTRNRGVIDTGCAIDFDNALHFIGDDFVVYRMAEVPTRISDHSLEERIAQSSSWKLFSFLWQGHAVLCVRLDSGTWVFDPAGGSEWPELQTYSLDNFIGQCAENIGDDVVFGSSNSNRVLKFSSAWTDDGYPLERRWTAAFPIKSGVVPVDTLEFECNAGATTASTGPGATPRIEVRASRDGGHTFGHYRVTAIGAQGERRKRPKLRRWGFFDAPGAVFDCRVTDPAPLRISAVLINEPSSGRSR